MDPIIYFLGFDIVLEYDKKTISQFSILIFEEQLMHFGMRDGT